MGFGLHVCSWAYFACALRFVVLAQTKRERGTVARAQTDKSKVRLPPKSKREKKEKPHSECNNTDYAATDSVWITNSDSNRVHTGTINGIGHRR